VYANYKLITPTKEAIQMLKPGVAEVKRRLHKRNHSYPDKMIHSETPWFILTR
jgi:hypothetical protein